MHTVEGPFIKRIRDGIFKIKSMVNYVIENIGI